MVAVLAGIITTIVSFPLSARWVVRAATTTLVDIDPREAERRLSNIGLPPNTASDFCLRYSPLSVSVRADFRMSEADFLNWMKAQKWTVVSLKPGRWCWDIPLEHGQSTCIDASVRPVTSHGLDVERAVKRGYCYFWRKPRNEDYTITIIYDLDTQRVHYEHTTY
jgi:hypothetical protein